MSAAVKGVEVPFAVYKVLRGRGLFYTGMSAVSSRSLRRLPTRKCKLICVNFIRQSLRLSLKANLIHVRNFLHESGMVSGDNLADSHDKRRAD